MRDLTLGFSPCPNDTYIFHALVHGLVETPGLAFRERLEDVETLNRLALEGVLDVSKVSYHALGFLRDEYLLLRSGGALGRGCGPLVVTKGAGSMKDLRGKPIAVPGRYTTAALLLRLFDPSLDNLVYLPFNEIMAGVARGEFAAGVIIHESRFTFPEYGLTKLLDLGAWWEGETGCPIPLGGIVARRSLGRETVAAIDAALRASVAHARSNPSAASAYIRAHSQEMSDEVCAAHIGLYVNDFSLQLGAEGELAVAALLGRAEAAGVIPRSVAPLFG
ncbi:1,4-dihydroxy-6-naphthoate synthase [Geobacter benzoatilyticus]|jgi:1,4-dihydroxy-6-naphthoate synthase|uniref:1,4-dihydroxy-6-naphtoate synthase n=1 Tax=Geobacter benzoatilyticus TaxID=2815309 RepID=A0ABX7Q663_9BACT|nr:1,4-dihydroxy-6-naphthoate synthase [Geobacter benzoatilyticus]QSV46933.1 1,4-dihydroxy-6-naphthoate synthase [Geobacter benzoatilyticus]